MAGKKKQSKEVEPSEVQLILRNRRVRHDYEILDEYEAGMVLQGSEVKSLRAGDVQWGDAHARLDHKRELYLYGLHIGEYRFAATTGHIAQARRKLLLNRGEIDKLAGSMQGKGLSIVPTALLFRRGWAKCCIAVVRGRKKEDKRRHMVDEAKKRDIQREMSRRLRG
jgi:SsrA-binding protein